MTGVSGPGPREYYYTVHKPADGCSRHGCAVVQIALRASRQQGMKLRNDADLPHFHRSAHEVAIPAQPLCNTRASSAQRPIGQERAWRNL